LWVNHLELSCKGKYYLFEIFHILWKLDQDLNPAMLFYFKRQNWRFFVWSGGQTFNLALAVFLAIFRTCWENLFLRSTSELRTATHTTDHTEIDLCTQGVSTGKFRYTMLGEGGWIVVLIKYFPGVVMRARAVKFDRNIPQTCLILQCKMCFCQVYGLCRNGMVWPAGLWKFSAVLPYFWFPTSIFINVLKPSPLHNMPKGKKAVVTFIFCTLICTQVYFLSEMRFWRE